jgi:acetyl-CoA synthetase
MVIEWSSEPVPDLSEYKSYEKAYNNFEWEIPNNYNIGKDVSSKSDKIALHCIDSEYNGYNYTFNKIDTESNRIANWLQERNIGRGDRVAVIASQRVETAIVNLAVFKLGAVSVPLSILYGKDALRYRLKDSGARAVFVAADTPIGEIDFIKNIDNVDIIVQIGDNGQVDMKFNSYNNIKAEESFKTVNTRSSDSAALLYTSGTTGQPKGVLQRHEYLLGTLPGFQMALEFPWKKTSPVIYSTSDWAWTGGLFTVLLSAWHYNLPVVAYNNRNTTAKNIVKVLDRYSVSHFITVPTVINMLNNDEQSDTEKIELDTIAVGGASISEETYNWACSHFQSSVNELYGLTEANFIISNCSAWFEPDPGFMGKPVPGHRIKLLDNDDITSSESEGEICVKTHDPAVLTEYWNNMEKTKKQYHNNKWFKTSDLAHVDEKNNFRFVARKDNVIITSGYRVSPKEVEEAILKLPYVKEVAVIGTSHDVKGEIVEAFVVLKDETEASGGIREEIKDFVKKQLGKYQYPRRVNIISNLPKTSTGKIERYKL